MRRSALRCALQCVTVWLQYVAVCRSVLQRVIACCSVLQCVTMFVAVQRVAVCCCVVQCVLQYVAECCSVLQCFAGNLSPIIGIRYPVGMLTNTQLSVSISLSLCLQCVAVWRSALQ